MASTTISSTIHPDYGFHRSFLTKISSSKWDKYADCHLYLYYKLPVLAFVDPYELANYRDSFTFHHHGNSNLELPVVAMDSEGSSLMLNVTHSGADLEVQVPFHLRYGEPALDGFVSAEVPMPDAFFSCPSEAPMVPSVWPTEFSFVLDGTRIVPIPPEPTAAASGRVTVPVGKPQDLPLVEAGTALTVILSFCYLAYIFYTTGCRLYGPYSKSKSE